MDEKLNDGFGERVCAIACRYGTGTCNECISCTVHDNLKQAFRDNGWKPDTEWGAELEELKSEVEKLKERVESIINGIVEWLTGDCQERGHFFKGIVSRMDCPDCMAQLKKEIGL